MEPNPQGLTSYHALLDDMQAKALQPIATLYQFNLPLMLQTKLEPTGWLNPDIVTHFEDFAELAFREFGKKVKYWATFDEPLTFISGKYGSRDVVSGAKKPSDMNIYTVAHNVLLSHARAVAVFRALKGDERNVIAAGARIGIMLSTEFGYPLDESDALNAEAAELEMQFSLGWLLMPIATGDYPAIMRERIGNRLPTFSSDEAALVKGSYDVFLLNNYNFCLKYSERSCGKLPQAYDSERETDETPVHNGPRMLPASSPGSSWRPGCPDSYFATIRWLHEKDRSTEILLTETSWCKTNQIDTLGQLRCFQVYIRQLYKAIVEEKIPIIGFTAQSVLDNNEHGSYSLHFGQYVNFTSSSTQGLPCNLHPVVEWFAHLATTKCLDRWDQEAVLSRKKELDLEAGGNDVDVPWSLSEVVILIIIGVLILGAITYEVMRKLRMSSQGSPEEVQVLITIED
ncbi:unnamed protein product [Peronospora belbahrii]|nr:unnamed protein product [Peronospora belbahrii]